MKKYLPIISQNISSSILLTFFLVSLAVSSFHFHVHEEDASQCSICVFHNIKAEQSDSVASKQFTFFPSLTVTIIISNETISDPSQHIVISSHAPPQIF